MPARECDSINGKKCYIQAKSIEKYSPVLSAAHSPSALTTTRNVKFSKLSVYYVL